MRQIVPRGFLSTVEATNLIGAHFVPGWTGLERDIAAASEDRAIRFPFIVTVETTSEDPQGHAARARWLQARERLVIELASSETGAEMLEDADGKLTPVPQHIWRSFKASDYLGDNGEGFPIWERFGLPSAEPIGLRVLIVEEFITQIIGADRASEESAEAVSKQNDAGQEGNARQGRTGRPAAKRKRIEKWIRAKYPNGGAEDVDLSDLISSIDADLGADFATPETVGRALKQIAKSQ